MQDNLVNNLPEWMLKKNSYSSKKDFGGYYTKTILSFFNLFRHFQINRLSLNKNISTFLSCNLLIQTLGLIILTSLSKNLFFSSTILAFLLISISLKPIDILKSVLGASITASLFTAFIMLPSFLIYKSNTIITITLKVFTSVGLLSLYAKTIPFNKITDSLRFFKIPNFLIFIIDLTLHYILILGNIAYDMLSALKLRNIGKNKYKQKSFSGILGSLFLKSLELSKETQQAMECRLFNGVYKSRKSKIKISDFLPLLVLLLFITFYTYIYINGVKK